MLRAPSSRAVAVLVLLGALFGLCVWYGTLGADPSAGAYPGEDDLGADYERYVGEQVELSGTVASVEPVVMVARYGAGEPLRLEVRGEVPRVAVGDSLRVFGVAEPDRVVRASTAIAVPGWGSAYMVSVSFLAGLWVLGRILSHWRLSDRGLVRRAEPKRPWSWMRSAVRREGGDA